MKLNLSADEVLTTTRAVRKRLDFERPVERSVVEECIEIAIQAPTGSNSQGWHWIIVEDQAKKQALPISTPRTSRSTSADRRPHIPTDDTRGERMGAVPESATYLAENFQRVPMMLVPCIEGRLDNVPSAASAGSGVRCCRPCGASCSPSRARPGLGVDDHPPDARRRAKAAEVLGIPYDKVSPGRPVPDRLHAGHRLQAGQAPTARRHRPLGWLVIRAMLQMKGAVVLLAVCAIVGVACGDDDETGAPTASSSAVSASAASVTTEPAAPTPPTTTTTTATTTTTTATTTTTTTTTPASTTTALAVPAGWMEVDDLRHGRSRPAAPTRGRHRERRRRCRPPASRSRTASTSPTSRRGRPSSPAR